MVLFTIWFFHFCFSKMYELLFVTNYGSFISFCFIIYLFLYFSNSVSTLLSLNWYGSVCWFFAEFWMHLMRVQWPNKTICGQSFSFAPSFFISSAPFFVPSLSSNCFSPNLLDACLGPESLKYSLIFAVCAGESLHVTTTRGRNL